MKSRKTLAIVLSLMMVVWMFAAVGIGNAATSTSKTKAATDSTLSMSSQVQSYLDKVDTTYFKQIAHKLAYDTDYQDNALGWRSAGSAAENKMAGYLKSEMENLGLENVQQSPITVDKFQFNSADFTIADTNIHLTANDTSENKLDAIASYQCRGTGGKDLTAKIVDCGAGLEADYAGKNVKGKIVLVHVDQSNVSWIDGYIRQAKEAGAAALITYANSGYGTINDDSVNVQDICCDDLIPTTAISYNNAQKIIKAINEGHSDATLNINNDFQKKGGTSYNIIGKIKGTGSTGQQILVASHYDKYWYGYQDDSTGIATVLSIAKAMKDSGYKPVNDIVFVCHGAEEWGASNTQFDWSNGSWHNITDVHPGWAGKTLALFNFELTAYGNGSSVGVSAVPEFRTVTTNFVKNSGLAVPATGMSIDQKSTDTNTMEDGICYRWAGVPYFVNAFDGTSFTETTYHTQFDNESTLDINTALTNLNLYGAMAIYTDQTPALQIDLTQTCKDLKNSCDKASFKKAGLSSKKYLAAVSRLNTMAKTYNKKIADVNARYEAAVKDGASSEKIDNIRDEGIALNRTTLKAFKFIQKNFIAIDTWGVDTDVSKIEANITTFNSVIKALGNKSAKKGIAAANLYAGNLNGAVDWNYTIFSKKVGKAELKQYDPALDIGNMYWCTDRLIPVYYVGNTTHDMANGTLKNAKKAKKVYVNARKTAYKNLREYGNGDINSMNKLRDIINLDY